MSDDKNAAAIREIALRFNELMRQLELGDHRDTMDHQMLMNAKLRGLRDAIAAAAPDVDVVTLEDARALAAKIAGKRKARNL